MHYVFMACWKYWEINQEFIIRIRVNVHSLPLNQFGPVYKEVGVTL